MAKILLYGRLVNGDDPAKRLPNFTVTFREEDTDVGSDITLTNGDFNVSVDDNPEATYSIEVFDSGGESLGTFDGQRASDFSSEAERKELVVDAQPAGGSGTDGEDAYIYIAYGTSASGANFSLSPNTNTTHIGVYFGSTDIPNVNNAGNYTWTQIKGNKGDTGNAGSAGAPGAPGAPGTPGSNGDSAYIYVAYGIAETSADGSGFSLTPQAETTHLGIYFDTVDLDDPNNYADYNWSQIKGEKGDKGDTGNAGAPGAPGSQGAPGEPGESAYVSIGYSQNSNGDPVTLTPDSDTRFIGVYTGSEPIAEPTDQSLYVWTEIKGEKGDPGEDGAPGAPGADGTDGAPGPIGPEGPQGPEGPGVITGYAKNTLELVNTTSSGKWVRFARTSIGDPEFDGDEVSEVAPSNRKLRVSNLFSIIDRSGNSHQAVIFSAGANFGNNPVINVLSNTGSWSGGAAIKKLRILYRQSSYFPMYVDAFVQGHSGSYQANIQATLLSSTGNDWTLIDFDDTVYDALPDNKPTNLFALEIDLAVNDGINTTQFISSEKGIKVGGNEIIDSAGRWQGDPTGLTGPEGPAGTPGSDGADGSPGADGSSAFVYIAYAEGEDGSGFSLSPTSTSKYIQFLSTDTEIGNPGASDFTGIWLKFQGNDTGYVKNSVQTLTTGASGKWYRFARATETDFPLNPDGSVDQVPLESAERYQLDSFNAFALFGPQYSHQTVLFNAGIQFNRNPVLNVTGHSSYAQNWNHVKKLRLLSGTDPYHPSYLEVFVQSHRPDELSKLQAVLMGSTGGDWVLQDFVETTAVPSNMNVTEIDVTESTGFSSTRYLNSDMGITIGGTEIIDSTGKWTGDTTGLQGADGRGISSVELVDSTTLSIQYTDDTTQEIDLSFLNMATPETFKVTGIIADIAGLPLTNKVVRAYHQSTTTLTLLGTAPSTSASGEYEITFTNEDLATNDIDELHLIVKAFEQDDTELIASPLIVEARQTEIINLAVGEGEFKGLIDYNFTDAKLGATVTRENVDTYTSSSMISDLAKQTNTDPVEVNRYVQLKKLAADNNVSETQENLLYGLAKAGGYGSLRDMLTASPTELQAKLDTALANGHIDQATKPSDIQQFITDFRTLAAGKAISAEEGENEALNSFFTANNLSTDQKTAYVTKLLDHEGTPADFFTALRADDSFNDAEVDDLEAFSGIVGITGDATFAEGFKSAGYANPQAMVPLTQSEVLVVLNDATFTWDDRFEGATEEEKKTNYAARILDQIENEYPTPVFAGRLSRDPDIESANFDTFFSNETDFKLEEEAVSAYLESHADALEFVGDTEAQAAFQEDLEGMQRLFKVAPDNGRFESIKPLWQGDIRSATQILRMGETSFMDQFSDLLGDDTAEVVYHKSGAIAGSLTHLFSEFGGEFSALTPFVIENRQFAADEGIPGIPNLEELFGSLDYCACKHCRSVYSAAAYMVDLLHWLSEVQIDNVDHPMSAAVETTVTNLKLAIDARRPEIQQIVTSCENTNTPLPYVDLVNEVLENAISDAPFYNRQTTQKASFLKAHPEYIKPDVYNKLRQEVYPWTVPFDLFAAESYVYYKHLGIRPSELLAQFAPSSTAGDLASKTLEINPLEKAIIIGDSTEVDSLTGSTIGFIEYMGGVVENGDDETDLESDLQSNVKLLMTRSGLTFNELQAYYQSDFINPDGDWFISFDTDACDPNFATTNLSKEGMLRLMRFHKLRMHLDWSIEELDRAILTLPGSNLDDTKFARIVGIHELAMKYRLDVDDVCVWYGDMSNLSYSDEPSLFTSTFVNPSVNNPDESYFIVDPELDGSPADATHPLSQLFDQSETATNSYKVLNAQLLPLVMGGTRLSDADVNALDAVITTTQPGGGTLVIKDLSYLYRVSSFTRAMDITVEEYLRYIELFDIEPILPFGSAGTTPEPAETKKFIDMLEATRKLGMDAEALDYVVGDINNAVALDTTQWEAQLESARLALVTAKDNLHIVGADTRDTVVQYLNLFLNIEQPTLTTPWTQSDLEEVISILDGTRGDAEATMQTRLEDLFEDMLDTPEITTIVDVTVISGPSPYVDNTDLEKRYADAFLNNGVNVLEAAVQKIIWPVVREQVIIDSFAEFFEIPATICRDLVTSRLEYYDGSGLSGAFIVPFTDDAFLDASNWGTAPLTALTENGRNLHKNAWLLNAFRASYTNSTENDLNYLYGTNTSNTGLPDLKQLYGAQLSAVAAYRNLWKLGQEHVMYVSNGSLFQVMEAAYTNGGTNATVDLLQNLTGWREVAETIGADVLNISNFQSTAWFFDTKEVSIAHAASLVKPTLLKDWVQMHVNAQIAQGLSNACKSKHGEERWFSISSDLRDAIRVQQRDALADYLIYSSDAYNFSDRYSLYEYFLIDTEMEPCRMTSRIKQANSTIQLFVQRVIMNLEPAEYKLTPSHVEEWEWRKNYRVWEANRKVFLYPENWMEPELRDDKSDLFKDLEAALQQGDVTMEIAENAFLDYLEKLDEISDLYVCQAYYDLRDDNFYAFARTKSLPHVYYSRIWKDDAWWTHWERMDVDIEGDHLVPSMYNGRLMVFWPSIREQAEEEDAASLASTSNSYTPQNVRKKLIVNLNWSEFKHGKWSKRKRSKDELFIEKLASEPDFGPKNLFLKTDLGNTWEPGIAVHVHKSYGDKRKFMGGFHFDTLRKEPRVYQPNLTAGYGTWSYDDQFRFQATQQGALPIEVDYSTSGNLWDVIYNGNWLSFYWSRENHPLLRDWTSPATYKVVPQHIPIYRQHVHGNIPFFFYDRERTLFVRPVVGKEPIYEKAIAHGVSWTTAALDPGFIPDLAEESLETDFFNYRADTVFFSGNNSNQSVQGTTVLVNGTDPDSDNTPPIIGYNETYGYQFHSFDHKYVTLMIRQLNRFGLDGLLKPKRWRSNDDVDLDRQLVSEEYFVDDYDPTEYVITPYPKNDVDFTPGGGYSIYNWELFFHAPLMIACELTKNRKFSEAQKWFHYIFDPTVVESAEPTETGKKRYWRTKPFHEFNGESSVQVMLKLLNGSSPESLAMQQQVEVWRKNPFVPYAVGRLRHVAFMKSVVMKYLDMLIAWGDQLFERDSIESVNEATQVYLLAYEILGRRPEEIERDTNITPLNYNQLAPGLDSFSNAMVRVENLIPVTYVSNQLLRDQHRDEVSVTQTQSDPYIVSTVDLLYFCVPNNSKLNSYWDTVEDRLFKIRNCMNIEGVVRQLPLFEPPIDPAMLVRAAAAGLSISEALSDMNAPMPFYKYNSLHQKAVELTNDVKSLGGALLSALEKKDAEVMAQLRNDLELRVLDATTVMKERAIEEAAENIESLKETKKITQEREKFYSSREYMIGREKTQIDKLQSAKTQQIVGQGITTISGVLALLPQFDGGVSGVGGSPTIKAIFGGEQTSKAVGVAGAAINALAGITSQEASITGIQAGHDRRMEDWQFQAAQAKAELAQIDKQIQAAEIRKAMAESDLDMHKQQIENNKEISSFMKDKYTNDELYSWMVRELSRIHFDAYRMAYDMAKRAEKAYQYELGFDDNSSYISFGLWDSLRKGLLTGEKLHQDLKRMNIAYTDRNKRDIELTKNVSLAMLNPNALEQLRLTGKCDFDIPEMLYDLDHPGHYRRRIKAITVSVPCVTGPYTGVTGKLSLLGNRIRTAQLIGSGTYQYTGINDDRFVHNITGIQSIATSRGQNDSGMFELSFNDARYLPFEGAGAISSWRFELPFVHDASANPEPRLRQFDYNTISDLILTVHYTSRDAGSILKAAAEQNVIDHVNEWLAEAAQTETGLDRVFSMKHEFPTEFHQFLHPAVSGDDHVTDIEITNKHFPHALSVLTKETAKVTLVLKLKEGFGPIATHDDAFALAQVGSSSTFTSSATAADQNYADLATDEFTSTSATAVAGTWRLTLPNAKLGTNPGLDGTGVIVSNELVPEAIDDIILVMNYKKA